MNGLYIHVQYSTTYNNEKFEQALARAWTTGVVYYYDRYYNFDEKSKEEWDLIKKWANRLKETMPEQYKTGCHLVAADAAYMGENIWVVEGKITHSLHGKHEECGGYDVLNHPSYPGWCGTCALALTKEEMQACFRG